MFFSLTLLDGPQIIRNLAFPMVKENVPRSPGLWFVKVWRSSSHRETWPILEGWKFVIGILSVPGFIIAIANIWIRRMTNNYPNYLTNMLSLGQALLLFAIRDLGLEE